LFEVVFSEEELDASVQLWEKKNRQDQQVIAILNASLPGSNGKTAMGKLIREFLVVCMWI
jgi:hypothetical protein